MQGSGSQYHGPEAIGSIISTLASRFGNRLVTSQTERARHADTASRIVSDPLDPVVFPETTAGVQEIVRLCPARPDYHVRGRNLPGRPCQCALRRHLQGVHAMGAVKRALDPHDIMNPGKVGGLV